MKCEDCKHEHGYFEEYCEEEGNFDAFYSWECELEGYCAPLCEDDECDKYEKEYVNDRHK